MLQIFVSCGMTEEDVKMIEGMISPKCDHEELKVATVYCIAAIMLMLLWSVLAEREGQSISL